MHVRLFHIILSTYLSFYSDLLGFFMVIRTLLTRAVWVLFCGGICIFGGEGNENWCGGLDCGWCEGEGSRG